MIARVVGEEVVACRLAPPKGIVFSDPNDSADFGVEFQSARGSRLRYLSKLNNGLGAHSHFIYDCGGMARGQGWFPFPKRPYLSFIMGIEAWPGTCDPKQVAALAKADQLIAISAYTRERACDVDPSFARAEVCWLATEADEPPTPHSPPNRPRVLILARLDRYKGHDELLACWPSILSKIPDAVLTIVGRGPREVEFRKRAAELGLTDRQVEFRGFVPDGELDDIWRSTSVFAMPSRGEGFGLVYIEAMRFGIPVISSIHDAAPEVNAEGVSGFNVNLDTSSELTDCLLELLNQENLAAELGQNGFNRWTKQFRFSSFRERFLPILNRFLGES